VTTVDRDRDVKMLFLMRFEVLTVNEDVVLGCDAMQTCR
jgi:hypothetical protein